MANRYRNRTNSQIHWRNSEHMEELKETMGNWLGDLAQWDAFCTWTFAKIVSVNGAMHGARRHISWIEKVAQQKIYGFVAAEKGKTGGLIHLHALLGNVKHMQFFCGLILSSVQALETKCCLTHAWPSGYANVFPYDPALGAKHYVAKYITKDLAEWDLFGLPLATQTAFTHKGSEFSKN